MRNILVTLCLANVIFLLPACLSEESKHTSSNTMATSSPQSTVNSTSSSETTASTLDAAPTLQPTVEIPTVTPFPSSVIDPVIFFARNDDLWRIDAHTQHVEQLTEGEVLSWGMSDGQDDWLINALSAPPQVSPDGRWIAFSPNGIELILVNVHNQTQMPPIRPGASVVAWSPDSRYLAYQGHESSLMPSRQNDDLYVYDLQEQEADLLASYEKDEGVGIVSLVWSPDGTQIGYGCCFESNESSGSFTGLIQRLEYSTGDITTTGEMKSSIGGGTPPLCWTNNGELKPDTEVEEAVRCSYTLPPPGDMSPDGTLIASLTSSASSDDRWRGASVVTIKDANSGEVVQELELGINATRVVWSLDGHYLLFDDREPNSPIWQINADGTSVAEEIVSDGYLLDMVTAWQSPTR